MTFKWNYTKVFVELYKICQFRRWKNFLELTPSVPTFHNLLHSNDDFRSNNPSRDYTHPNAHKLRIYDSLLFYFIFFPFEMILSVLKTGNASQVQCRM